MSPLARPPHQRPEADDPTAADPSSGTHATLPIALPIVSATNPTDTKQSATPSPLTTGNTPRGNAAWRQRSGSAEGAGERLGRRGLNQLRDRLSDRDIDVLRSVCLHRFLTTSQIEQLHFTAHTTQISAARTCRRVLLRLAELRLLRHLERRIGGVRAGSASFIWTIGPVGSRLLDLDVDGADNRVHVRHREPSERFVDHALAVADTHLRLLTASRTNRLELVTAQTEPDCWRPYLGPGGERRTLQPDLYAVTASGEFEDCWFLEIDLGNEHLPTILAKCRQYESYRRTGLEQHDSGTFPIVIWIMSNRARAERLDAALDAARSLDRTLFRVCTPDRLLDVVHGGVT